MSEATDILRSYVRLVERLSGAGAASLYVPPGASGEREILLHEGLLQPLPELADEGHALDLHRRFGEPSSDPDEGAVRLPSRDADGVLYRVPLGWVLSREDAAGPNRRKRDGRRMELTAWKDRKSTRLNSSHSQTSYAVFCLKK